MAVTVQEKAKVIADYQRIKGDTGSPEVQVALLTARILKSRNADGYRSLIEKLGLRK